MHQGFNSLPGLKGSYINWHREDLKMDGHFKDWMGQEQRHRIIKITSSRSWKSFKLLLLSLTVVAVSGMITAFRGQDGNSSLPDALI